MKTINLIIAASILTSSGIAVAEGVTDRTYGRMIQSNEQAMRDYAISKGKPVPEVVHYRYGMDLDIDTIISLTPTDAGCDVMPAQITYEDSSGKLNILEYRVNGTGCTSQN
ncbi:DUF2790 domain-containing protein [Pseudomonas sp. NPDC078700]|uniref:DUF2790 domain-containing protein n=1 Tax=Pseudomonas sp. NPDC078700 TaxID=3364424 RepID=UPI0037C96701